MKRSLLPLTALLMSASVWLLSAGCGDGLPKDNSHFSPPPPPPPPGGPGGQKKAAAPGASPSVPPPMKGA